jgi:four helix bundle protein
MNEIQSYGDLLVWQEAMKLVKQVYQVTRLWPRDEVYGLVSQARRAAVSVPSNIAEGRGRHGTGEFRHHLSIAYGSLMELETQLLIADQLGYQDEKLTALLLEQCATTGRLINALTKALPAQRPARPLTIPDP